MRSKAQPAGKPVDAHFLRLALAQAQAAGAAGEVPVGAVLVHQGQVIATGHNAVIGTHDPSAHAEIVALRRGGQYLGNYRLQDCELYVTLEPCAMCAGAIAHARLARVVYGVRDVRAGAAGSVLDVLADSGISHKPQAICAQEEGGEDSALLEDLADLLPHFFHAKRQAKLPPAWPLRPDALRTPESCFLVLEQELGPRPAAHYCQDLPSLAGLRMHYWDSLGAELGAKAEGVVDVCLHDGDGWSQDFAAFYAERAAAARVLVPDLPGFGRSDKLKKRSVYSPAWWLQVLLEWLEAVAPQAWRTGQLRLVLQNAQHPLLPLLWQARPELQGQVWVMPAGSARRAWQQLPYPDAGHRAGILAWRSCFLNENT